MEKSQVRDFPNYGKTREGVPYSAFFEGRRSLGSRRLKCSGFGLQHLWFCYRSKIIPHLCCGVRGLRRFDPIAYRQVICETLHSCQFTRSYLITKVNRVERI